MPRLTRELWDTLKPLLDEALDLLPSQRAGLLTRLRTDSPLLARELEALLADDLTEDDALFDDAPIAEMLSGGPEARQVGPYTLDRCIGHGGMGTVWLAHRSDGRYEGDVAVKLLNFALVGRAGAQRFAQEGSVLARIGHPGIARLLDAGVTTAGQPYLVLEHVTGMPIDEFADAQRCTIDERIRLCRDVLDAVAAAHAALVVHRDIKPSNILVDADGRVKLLDFGIAKLLAARDQTMDAGTLTDHAGRALTPDYAAPEVILGEPVSTATDVYSVGVLLYVLLTGRHPTGHDCRTAAEHIRSVLEVEPPPASAAFATGRGARAAELEERAALRDATPPQLVRRFRGDLDNILARALKKVPAERYASVGALADDLLRFTRHQPVSAHADSWAYRTRKFARRHRAGIAAAAMVVLSLIGASGFSFSQMRVAQLERDRADRALRRSQASTAFETLLFRLLEPGGQPLTYEQLLDRGRVALEQEYRGDPISRMQIGVQFAVNYLRGNDPATADTIIRRTVAIADSLADSHWQGRTRCELAGIYATRGAGDSAAALLRTARAFLAEAREVEDGTRNACDLAEGDAMMALQRYDSAAFLFGAIVERRVEEGDTMTERYVFALNDLSRAYFSARRFRDAQRITQRLVQLAHAGATSDPQAPLALGYNLAISYEMLGELVDNRRFLQHELALAAADPTALRNPMLLFEYGRTLEALEQYDSATIWLERTLDRDPDDTRAYVAHAVLARIARRTARSPEDVQRHELEMARLDSTRQAVLFARSAGATYLIETASARRDPAALRVLVDAQLDSLDYSAESTSRNLIQPLITAATAFLEAGAPAEADSLAAQVVRIGSADAATTQRSAIVGHGMLLRARAALARGDTAAARTLVARAMPALAFGYGTRHSVHTRAEQLARALRN